MSGIQSYNKVYYKDSPLLEIHSKTIHVGSYNKMIVFPNLKQILKTAGIDVRSTKTSAGGTGAPIAIKVYDENEANFDIKTNIDIILHDRKPPNKISPDNTPVHVSFTNLITVLQEHGHTITGSECWSHGRGSNLCQKIQIQFL